MVLHCTAGTPMGVLTAMLQLPAAGGTSERHNQYAVRCNSALQVHSTLHKPEICHCADLRPCHVCRCIGSSGFLLAILDFL